MPSLTMRAGVGTLGAAAFLFVASMAQGTPIAGGELRVSRTGAAGDCPDEETLGASTLALGAQPIEPARGDLTVEVELDRDASGYVARIHSTGRKSGVREIRSPGEDCQPLAEATSVALAILFDLLPPEPDAPDPPPLPLLGAPALPRSERTDKDAPALREPSHRRPEPDGQPPSLGAYGGLASGLLGHALTGHAGVVFRTSTDRRIAFSAGGFWAPGREIAYAPGTVWVSLIAARGDLSLAIVRKERIELGGRLVVAIGALLGQGSGFDRDHAASEFWLAPGLGALGRYRLSRHWALTLGTTLLFPHRPQTFSVFGMPGKAFESSPAAALVEFGPELAFF